MDDDERGASYGPTFSGHISYAMVAAPNKGAISEFTCNSYGLQHCKRRNEDDKNTGELIK